MKRKDKTKVPFLCPLPLVLPRLNFSTDSAVSPLSCTGDGNWESGQFITFQLLHNPHFVSLLHFIVLPTGTALAGALTGTAVLQEQPSPVWALNSRRNM